MTRDSAAHAAALARRRERDRAAGSHKAPCVPVPAPEVVHAMSDAELVAMALKVTALDTPALACTLKVAPGVIACARRTPAALALAQRLILATIVGRIPQAAVVARELRRRTRYQLRRSPPPPTPRSTP